MHTLKEALISNCSITQLSLASVGITCEGMDHPLPRVNTSGFTSSHFCLVLISGAVALAEFLAETRFLQTLDVRQNFILTGGLMAFTLALKLNHTLVHLDLDQNPKEEKVRECEQFTLCYISYIV